MDGRGAAVGADLHIGRRRAPVLPALAHRGARRDVLLAVHAGLAARPRRRRDPLRHPDLRDRARCRPRGAGHLPPRPRAHGQPHPRDRERRDHGGVTDPHRAERDLHQLPLLARSRSDLRRDVSRRAASRAALAGDRRRTLSRLSLHDPPVRRGALGRAVRRLRALPPMGTLATSRAHRAVVGGGLPPVRDRDAALQPARHRELHGVPHHVRRPARHVRLRHEEHRDPLAEDSVRAPRRRARGRAQPAEPAALPLRDLRRPRRRRGRTLVASARPLHDRVAAPRRRRFRSATSSSGASPCRRRSPRCPGRSTSFPCTRRSAS